MKPWGEAATVSIKVVRGSWLVGGWVLVGGDVVVAVEVGAAEEVDDVEAEVVAGAGVAAGELLVVLGGVLAVQGHGALVVEDLVDVDQVDAVVPGPAEHVAVRGVGVGGAWRRWRGGVGGAEQVARSMSVQTAKSWSGWAVAAAAKVVRMAASAGMGPPSQMPWMMCGMTVSAGSAGAPVGCSQRRWPEVRW